MNPEVSRWDYITGNKEKRALMSIQIDKIILSIPDPEVMF